MNAYEKLLLARVKLQESQIKKSGKNQHLRFDYFELADFLPTLNQINAELKLISVFSIEENKAVLKVINAEAPDEQIVFESTTAQAKLQGNASPIQELGSQHTYMRRYLYLMAYEIIECDSLDAQIGSQQAQPQKQTNIPPVTKTINDAQLKRLYAIASKKGRTGDHVQATIKAHYKIEHMLDLTKRQYDEAVAKYESMPDAEKNND